MKFKAYCLTRGIRARKATITTLLIGKVCDIQAGKRGDMQTHNEGAGRVFEGGVVMGAGAVRGGGAL